MRLMLLFLVCAFSAPAISGGCLVETTSGDLRITTQPVSECSGYVVLDAQEYSQYPTLKSLFAFPDAKDLGKVWSIGAGLPMFSYLIAWAFGSVINFINPRE